MHVCKLGYLCAFNNLQFYNIITRRIDLRITNIPSYHIDDELVQRAVKNKKLNVSQHLRSTTAKAHTCRRLILKCFLLKDLVVLYPALVLFALDHCNVSGIKKVKAVQPLQRKFTKGFEGWKTLIIRNADRPS